MISISDAFEHYRRDRILTKSTIALSSGDAGIVVKLRLSRNTLAAHGRIVDEYCRKWLPPEKHRLLLHAYRLANLSRPTRHVA